MIESLREQFPNEKWRWDRQSNRWLTESGWGVYRCVASTSWGDDSYELRYYTTEGERIIGLKDDGKVYSD